MAGSDSLAEASLGFEERDSLPFDAVPLERVGSRYGYMMTGRLP